MRRSTRLGIALAALLVVVLGGYTAFWFVAAGRIESGIGDWAQSLRAQNLDLTWRAIRVGGFPLSFRIELGEARLRNTAVEPAAELSVPLLTGSAHPWGFRTWRLAAPQGLRATAGAALSLSARSADGSIAIADDGTAAVWLGLADPVASTPLRVAAGAADFWLTLSPQAAAAHTDAGFGLAFDIRALTLPAVPAPLRPSLDEVAAGITVRGAFAAAPLRRAAAAWRDAGGTIDVDRFALRWGDVAVTGSGTLALDSELQPMGSFSGAVEGYQELMTGLAAAGVIRAGDARVAGIALAFMAKRGPDGKPQIAVPFTIQDGQMYLGPAKLGPAPRIEWP